MEAMLLACGERGFRGVTQREVVSRAGVGAAEFASHFSDPEQCFAAAYEWEAERLAAAILARADAGSSWRDGLRAALDELAAYLTERPLQTRALLLEVHVAGGAALAHRSEILERLSSAVDRGRRATHPAGSPPPLTALFMVGAIEAAAVSALVSDEPESFAAAVPELEQLIAAAYFQD